MTDLAELRRVAEAATKAPVYWRVVADDLDAVNRRYLAAANPAATIALLDRLASAEAALRVMDNVQLFQGPRCQAAAAHFAKWEKPDAPAPL